MAVMVTWLLRGSTMHEAIETALMVVARITSITIYTLYTLVSLLTIEEACKRDSSTRYFPSFFFLSISLNSTLLIFPEIVFGRASTNSISRGYLYGAVTRLT